MTYHIPNLGGCWWESRPDWCNEDPGHDGRPTDSPWRRVARAGGR